MSKRKLTKHEEKQEQMRKGYVIDNEIDEEEWANPSKIDVYHSKFNMINLDAIESDEIVAAHDEARAKKEESNKKAEKEKAEAEKRLKQKEELLKQELQKHAGNTNASTN